MNSLSMFATCVNLQKQYLPGGHGHAELAFVSDLTVDVRHMRESTKLPAESTLVNGLTVDVHPIRESTETVPT